MGTDMDRRQFLRLGAAAGTLPFFFSGRLSVGPDGLPGAIARARARGKPLLVLVIPRDDRAKWVRGQALGSWINHGSDQGMADLALVDVVCAGADEVGKLSPEIDPALEPWMFLVDTRGELPMVLPVDPELPEPAVRPPAMPNQPDEAGRARIRVFETAFRDAVVRGVRLEVWARQSARVLSRAEVRKLDSLSLSNLDDGLLERGAARLALAARDRSPAVREQVTSALAAAAERRLRQAPPSGAKWARSTGCGTQIEGEENPGAMMVACGMGMVPELSRRFLYFFSQ